MATHKAPVGFYDWAGGNGYPDAVLDGLYSVYYAINASPPGGGSGIGIIDAINDMSDRLHADLLQQVVDIVNELEGLNISIQNGTATLNSTLTDIKNNQSTNTTDIVNAINSSSESAKDSVQLYTYSGTVGIGATITSGLYDTLDYPSFTAVVESDIDILFKYTTYNQAGGLIPSPPTQAPLSFIGSNPESDGKFRLRVGNVNVAGGSWKIDLVNTSGSVANVTVYLIGHKTTKAASSLPLEFPVTKNLNAPLFQGVIKTEVLDANLIGTGLFRNLEQAPNGGLLVASPNSTVFEYRIPPASSIPSGSIPTINAVKNLEANVIDSGWYAVGAFPAGQFLNWTGNRAVKIFLLNAEDATGKNMVGNNAPFLTPLANTGTPFAAPYFDKYSRVIVVNDSGASLTAASLFVRGKQVETASIYTALDQPIFDQFPAKIGQSVIKGKDDVTGIYHAPNIHKDVKGTSLVVAQGHRLSDIFSRTRVRGTASGQGQLSTPTVITIRNVAAGKAYFPTFFQVYVSNTSVSLSTTLSVADGSGNFWNISVPSATNQTPTLKEFIVESDSDPLRITGNFTITIPSGNASINVNVNHKGYEETI